MHLKFWETKTYFRRIFSCRCLSTLAMHLSSEGVRPHIVFNAAMSETMGKIASFEIYWFRPTGKHCVGLFSSKRLGVLIDADCIMSFQLNGTLNIFFEIPELIHNKRWASLHLFSIMRAQFLNESQVLFFWCIWFTLHLLRAYHLMGKIIYNFSAFIIHFFVGEDLQNDF